MGADQREERERTMRARNKQTGETRDATIEEAAEIAGLDIEGVEWAIEEHGRCDTDEWAIGETDAEIAGEWREAGSTATQSTATHADAADDHRRNAAEHATMAIAAIERAEHHSERNEDNEADAMRQNAAEHAGKADQHASKAEEHADDANTEAGEDDEDTDETGHNANSQRNAARATIAAKQARAAADAARDAIEQ